MLLIVAAAAVVVRVVHLLTMDPGALAGLGEIRDSYYYDHRARQIASGDLLGDHAEFLSPLYCVVLGVLKAISLESPAEIRFAQAGLAAVACCLVALLAWRMAGRVAGYVAGVGFALYPPFVFYSGTLLPTTVTVLANLAAFSAFLVARETQSGKWFAVTGIFLGLAVLAKANALLLIPLFVVGALLEAGRAGWRRKIPDIALLVAAAAVVISPVALKNTIVTGEFVSITSTTGRNLLRGNGPDATGTRGRILLTPEQVGGGLRAHLSGQVAEDPAMAVRASRSMSEAAIETMLGEPWRAVRLFARKLFFFVHGRELVIRDDYPEAREESWLLRIPIPGYALLLPMAVFGLVALGLRRTLWPYHVMLLAQVASFVLIFVLARYRMVAVALFWVIFAAGLVKAHQLWREKARARIAVGVGAALVAAVVTHWPVEPPSPMPSSARGPKLGSALHGPSPRALLDEDALPCGDHVGSVTHSCGNTRGTRPS